MFHWVLMLCGRAQDNSSNVVVSSADSASGRLDPNRITAAHKAMYGGLSAASLEVTRNDEPSPRRPPSSPRVSSEKPPSPAGNAMAAARALKPSPAVSAPEQGSLVSALPRVQVQLRPGSAMCMVSAKLSS